MGFMSFFVEIPRSWKSFGPALDGNSLFSLRAGPKKCGRVRLGDVTEVSLQSRAEAEPVLKRVMIAN